MKKLMSILVSVVMLMSLSISVSAATGESGAVKTADWKMRLEQENDGKRVVNAAAALNSSFGDLWVSDTARQEMSENGASVALDGMNDKIWVCDDNEQNKGYGNLLENKSEFTISQWVNISSMPSGKNIFVVDKDPGFRIQISEGAVTIAMKTDSCEWYNNQTICVGNVIRENTWHHIAVTMNNSGTALYVDGVKRGEKSAMKGAIVSNGAQMLLGRADFDVTREIGETAIYDKTLTENEIKNIAAKPLMYLNGKTEGENLKNVGSVGDVYGKVHTTITKNGYIGTAMSYASEAEGDCMTSFNNLNDAAYQFKDKMSVSAWVNIPNDSANADLDLLFRDGSYMCRINGDGSFQVIMGTNNTVEDWYSGLFVSQNAMEKGKWNHVAFVYDGRNVSLYLNGKKEQLCKWGDNASKVPVDAEMTGNINYGGWTAGNAICVGRASDAGVKADIDELCVYDYALTADAVDKLYNIESFEAKNLMGKPVKVVTAGSKIYADAKCIVGAEDKVDLILALYDRDGALVDAVMNTIDGATYNGDIEKPVYFATNMLQAPESVGEIGVVRAFLWDKNMKPYAHSEER